MTKVGAGVTRPVSLGALCANLKVDFQSSFISSRGFHSDIRPGSPDPNPIMDIGCPSSISGVKSAVALSLAMGIDFKLRCLDCEPFYHGYGTNCTDAELAMAIWDMPITDIAGVPIKIPFHVTPGDGPILLGNEILHKSRILGPENLLVIPPGVRALSSREVSLQTYSESISTVDSDAVRTYLLVVPAKTSSLQTFTSSIRTFFTRKKDDPTFKKKFSEGRAAKRLAIKLHGYTHLPLSDMITICTRGGVMNPILKQALERVIHKCTSCSQTGRPLNSRKVSFGKILAQFNEHVQLDFFWIDELGSLPIFHMVDKHTGFSVTVLSNSRDMEEISKLFELRWINTYGPPAVVSGDQEFFNSKFTNTLRYFGV